MQEAPDGHLVSLTEAGRWHVRRLRLNRPQLVALRLRRVERLTIQEQNAWLATEIHELEQQQTQVLALLRDALRGDEAALERLRDMVGRR